MGTPAISNRAVVTVLGALAGVGCWDDGGMEETGGSEAGGVFTPSSEQSCIGLGDICQGENCCTSIPIPGGTFMMGRSASGTDASPGDFDEQPEHSVTLSGFRLDKYEITVGRFRKFVEAYPETGRLVPVAGAGKSPVAGDTGWDSAWDAGSNSAWAANLPEGRAALLRKLNCAPGWETNPSEHTWTNSPGSNESLPQNCLNWYLTNAFCIWDGGRLPTEAEWEYAAAGGSENRLYPWGATAPAHGSAHANSSYDGNTPKLSVGSYSKGNGRWGHADLAGSLREWTLDWYNSDFYSDAAATGTNVGHLPASSNYRVLRGGWYRITSSRFRAAYRESQPPGRGANSMGARCARSME